MNTSLPRTIPEYLDQLRAALANADPALLHDALYDAEEYLRSEFAEHPERSEADVIAEVASSYGAPEEVADIYRDTEVRVDRALRTPPRTPHTSPLGRFFGVIAEPRTYAALFYMLLSLATGIFYFTWAVAGASLSAGLAILIIGLPFLVLFLGSVRMLSLVEGRIVEVMLGERMPRRPVYSDRDLPWLTRVKNMFTDPRTWSTLVYFLLMLPLGIVYFTLAVTCLSVSIALIVAPVLLALGAHVHIILSPGFDIQNHPWSWPLSFVGGVLLLFATMHLARLVGTLHGRLAKHLLVKA
ncbi:MAG: sensor domain-containing protein [Lysobacterales bacterium]